MHIYPVRHVAVEFSGCVMGIGEGWGWFLCGAWVPRTDTVRFEGQVWGMKIYSHLPLEATVQQQV